MRFISTLIIFYLIWQVVKFIIKIAFRYWLKKNAGKAFQFTNSTGYQQPRPEGEIKVDSFENRQAKPQTKNKSDLGEYVDYEEIK